MASCYTSLALFFLCVSSLWAFNLQTCKGRRFSFDVHHRFSDHVKKWVEENGGDSYAAGDWPQRGSVDYYAALAHHDRTFRGRGLSDNDPDRTLTFSDGNATLKIDSLGFLHYTAVTLGTPNVTFLVALDTGSDLFWVPCDCISCAPTSSPRYQIDVELSIYSLNSSSTSKTLPCNNSLCDVKKECYEGGSSCPYEVAYVSADTSSSGILVEDIMYLTTEDSNHEIIRAPIVFGCGRIQTGSFLDVAAPNGLFGLGMEKISVPSILSASGLTRNSFSMCFGQNGIGRITFGDKGTLDQDETPFNIRQTHPTYNISVTGIRVGANLIDIGFYAVIDSGTSFTYLADPEYTLLCESFHSQALDSRQSPDSRIPFEYCYSTSPSQNASMIPGVSLTMKGGAQYSVNEPVVVISIQEELVYCLGVIKSRNLNFIGQNFMTGNRIVFDRERYILGWKRYDCYETDDSSSLPVNPHNNTTAEPPSIVVGHDPYTPEATKETGGGGTQVSEVPHLVSHSNPMWKSCFRQNNFLLLLFILCLVIL